MRMVPAGVSKAGKPYEAFEACSDRCGWRPAKEEGYTKKVVTSQLPSKVPQVNGEAREAIMRESYRKDLMCCLIKTYGETANSNELISLHRIYWGEIENPMGKV